MRASKIDRCQPEIVKALRDFGATVIVLSTVGKGCPDLLVGYAGENHCLELKMPGGKLTPDQCTLHASWGGRIRIVHTPKEAIEAIVKGAHEQ
jgi:hypothetical protein